MITCTRRLEFDAAHRITRHGSKCRNLHGHRYVVELTAQAEQLDELGMVVDFGLVKALVGSWIDEHLDHGAVLHERDEELARFVDAQGWKLYIVPWEPTAEHLAEHLLHKARDLLAETRVEVVKVRLYETPNCWAEASCD